MKYIYAIFIMTITMLNLLAFKADFSFVNHYDNNVFELSDTDLDFFEKGNKNFDYIKTSDDFVTNSSLKINHEIKFGKIVLKPYIKGSYRHYFSNNEKSDFSILSGTDIKYLTLSLSLDYGYYPNTYLRQYIDRDGTGKQEKYEYEKSMYKSELYISIFKKNRLYFYFKYDEYYFNKFFTEYDGTANTIGFGWRHTFRGFYLKVFYYYRIMQTDNHIDNTSQIVDWTEYESFRDASYESDKFSISFRNKRIKLNKSIKFVPTFYYSLENRFYTTNLPIEVDNISIDPIHSTREDKIYKMRIQFIFYFSNKINITLDYAHEYRKVNSDYDNLDDLKDFIRDKIGLNLSYTLNIY